MLSYLFNIQEILTQKVNITQLKSSPLPSALLLNTSCIPLINYKITAKLILLEVMLISLITHTLYIQLITKLCQLFPKNFCLPSLFLLSNYSSSLNSSLVTYITVIVYTICLQLCPSPVNFLFYICMKRMNLIYLNIT